MLKVKEIVKQSATLQEKLYQRTDPRITTATGKVNFIAMMSTMGQFDLGGARWPHQFVRGFPIIGDLSQSGIYPTDPKSQHAPDHSSLWTEIASRFRTRAGASGWPNADTLWQEALGQVTNGWLTPHLPIREDGQCPDLAIGPVNVSFRFGVGQMNKLRACDDLKYGAANLYCSVWAPIKLPTWRHIAQMAASVRRANCDWSFFKTDHESPYKQLPLGPAHQSLTAAALRQPHTGTWMAFAPRALLFGAVAAVLRYNAFSRSLAVLFCKITGTPLSYFGDFGALVPSEILDPTLQAFMAFCQLLGVKLKDPKTEKDRP